MGNLREVFTTHLVAEALRARGHDVVHLHSWDDYDRLRKVPAGVDAAFERYIGMPLARVPDPWDADAGSYAEHWMDEFTRRAARARHRDARGAPVRALPGGRLQRRDPPRDGRARAHLRHARRAADLGSPRHARRGPPARLLPVQAVLRDLRARRHAGHRLGRHGRDVPLPPRPRGRDVARRRRDDQRQARVEGRLADALGLRGRRVRARRRGPPRADRQLHRRQHARARGLRRPGAALRGLLVRLARRAGRQAVGLGRRRADPRDGAAACSSRRSCAGCTSAGCRRRASPSTCRRRACRSSTTSGTASWRAPPARTPTAADAAMHRAAVRTSAGDVAATAAPRLVPAARRRGRPHAGQPRADRADRRAAPRRAGAAVGRAARRARAAPVVRDRLRRAAARRAAHDGARSVRRADVGRARRHARARASRRWPARWRPTGRSTA